MEIILFEEPCQHEVGKAYLNDIARVWFVGSYWDSDKTLFYYIDLEDGTVIEYESLEELDKDNPDDVEVNAELIIK